MEHMEFFNLKKELFKSTSNWIKDNEKNILNFGFNTKQTSNLNLFTEPKNLKPFFELIFLLCFGKRDTVDIRDLKEIADKGIEICEEKELLSTPFLFPPYKYLAMIYSNDFRNKSNYTKDRIMDNRNLTVTFKSEIIAYQNILGISDLNKLKRYYNETLLGRETSLIHMNNNDMYLITHTIFFMSLLNREKITNVLTKSQIMYSSNVMKSLIIFCLKIGQYDLLGECLICLLIFNGERVEPQDLKLINYSMKILKNNLLLPVLKTKTNKKNFEEYYHVIFVLNILGGM